MLKTTKNLSNYKNTYKEQNKVLVTDQLVTTSQRVSSLNLPQELEQWGHQCENLSCSISLQLHFLHQLQTSYLLTPPYIENRSCVEKSPGE